MTTRAVPHEFSMFDIMRLIAEALEAHDQPWIEVLSVRPSADKCAIEIEVMDTRPEKPEPWPHSNWRISVSGVQRIYPD